MDIVASGSRLRMTIVLVVGPLRWSNDDPENLAAGSSKRKCNVFGYPLQATPLSVHWPQEGRLASHCMSKLETVITTVTGSELHTPFRLARQLTHALERGTPTMSPCKHGYHLLLSQICAISRFFIVQGHRGACERVRSRNSERNLILSISTQNGAILRQRPVGFLART